MYRTEPVAKPVERIVIENARLWAEIAARNGFENVPNFIVTQSGQAFRPL